MLFFKHGATTSAALKNKQRGYLFVPTVSVECIPRYLHLANTKPHKYPKYALPRIAHGSETRRMLDYLLGIIKKCK
ncbi:MAG TPA: hypothetical protein CFH81_02565 [Sulfurovum sp. UBA12169]|nr:MAG TPA: hypothetical protein CFH81_02565 [Sulfurovum sp. UBA12169]